MKYIVPRRGIVLFSFMSLCCAFGFVSSWLSYRSTPPQYYDSDRSNAIMMMGVTMVMLLVLLAALIHELTENFSFRPTGQNLSTLSTVASRDTLTIGPLTGLFDKALLVELDCRLPLKAQCRIAPLRFYKKLPPEPDCHYRLQLVGRNAFGETLMAKRDVTQPIRSIWGPGGAEGESDAWSEIEIPVSQQFSEYYLRVQSEMDYKKSAPDAVSDAEEPFEVAVKLGVGLRANKLSGYQGASLGRAHAQLISANTTTG